MKRNVVRKQIEKVLETMEEARNDDKVLAIEVWRNYLPESRTIVTFEEVLRLPSQEAINRIRRKIQNDEKRFLPTDEKIRKRRKISEKEWLEYLWTR